VKVGVEPCGVHGFAHLRIYEDFDGSAHLDAVALDVERDTPLEYFANETFGATLGGAAAMGEHAGNGNLGATRRVCIKTGEPCPSDPLDCCGGSCRFGGSYRRLVCRELP
jgi:hypothetical protein